jgi:hypothetical protein
VYEPLETWAWDVPDDVKLAWLRNAFTLPPAGAGDAFERWVEGLARSPQFEGLYSSEFSMVGIKMSPGAFQDHRPLLELLGERSTRLIVLSRINRIKHALSLYRYFEEHKSQFDRDGVRPPSKVKLRRFDRWVRRSTIMHNELQEFAEAARSTLKAGSILPVAYEEFVNEEGKTRTMDRIASFLGLDSGEMYQSGFQKATPDDLAAAVVNYRRLRRRYRRSPMHVYFDD